MTNNTYTTDLFKLMAENPDLPVVPMVDAEICDGEDNGYFMGSWGLARVDEYLIAENSWSNAVLFKSDEDIFGTLESYLSEKDFDNLPDDDKECETIYNNLPWTKAIIVYIGMCE